MSASLSTLRVLLVDDSAHTRAIVAAILTGAGIQHVRPCRDGDEALRVLRQWPADVAIVDFVMAPVDGVTFTRKVRGDSKSPNRFLPIIMMTGHAERKCVEEARDAGVTEFAVKPVSAGALLGRLNAAINKPRPFVGTATYFGPDRRRRQHPGYCGPWRRKDDVVDDQASVIYLDAPPRSGAGSS